jgi:hypothetical protein
VQECVIGIILTQEVDGKEFPIASLSRRHIDAETRYAFVEKRACLFTMLAVNLDHIC